MSNDQFTKLFNHMNQRFDELRGEIQGVRGDVNDLRGVVDGVAGDIEDLKLEAAVSIRQYDRHEEWIKRAARQLKIDYDPAG